MKTLYDRIMRQLDTLVPFLALAGEEAFDLIRREQGEWFTPEQQDALPHTLREYRCQVAHSAFLLGYSYFEAFLADLVRAILLHRPAMLPQTRELKYSEILECGGYDAVIGHMVDKEVLAVFYGSMTDTAGYFVKRLHLPWSESGGCFALVQASLVRNCLLHNGGRADVRLAQVSSWEAGDRIELSPGDVHEYGIEARDLGDRLWPAAQAKHLRNISS